MTLDTACSRFAVLSDPIRLRLMALMQREGELCVCEMTQALDIPQPKASKHLAVLRQAGLVRMRRNAQWVLYALEPGTGDWLVDVLGATLRELERDRQLAEDSRRLSAMKERPGPCRGG